MKLKFLAVLMAATGLTVRAEEAKPAAPAAPAAGEKVQLGDPAKGKVTYDTYCALCHGPAGKGDGAGAAALPPPKPRDFTNKEEMAKIPDSEIVHVITKGGASIGKSMFMAPWEAVLKPDQIKDVAAYVRTLAK